MKPVSLGLGLKFSLAVTVLIVLAMTGVAVLVISNQKDALREHTARSSLTMVKNLAHDAAGPMLVFDPLRLDELVRTVQEATSCAYAAVMDREELIVAHTTRARLSSRRDLVDPPALATPASPDGETVRRIILEGEPVTEYTVPIHIGSEFLGSATIAYSVRTMDALIERELAGLRRSIFVITGIVLLLGIAGAFGVSTLLTRPLTRLKQKMQDVQAGNLHAEVENPRLVRCWERLGCDRKDCPSYGKTRCWAVAGTFCHGAVQGQFAQKIGDCRNCVVYQESSGDEIGELVEVFNQMVKDLRYNLTELEKVNTEKARMERLSALGEMATTVAHETKNPLNSIRLAASYLKKNFQGEILSEFLSIIEEEVMRLNEITSDFLGFSKPAPLKLKTTDINAIVKSTVELVRQEATDRNIEVVILTDEHVPPVLCDFSRMKQAVLNLLLNAIDASTAGSAIIITTEAAGASMTLSVQDSGRGIPPEEIENIFKPFYTTKTRGSGLGLAIVDRIVKEHKGEIAVESAVGKGTKFTIVLPVYEHAGI
ncbi:MAG: ATP-binding protein [Nitrospirota bacterium]